MRHPEVSRGVLALTFAIAAALPVAPALAAPEKALVLGPVRPLVMEGKKTLFQRVITHPGARPMDGPGGAPAKVEEVKPFTVLYVYDHREKNGRQWSQCGTGTRGRNLFWLRDGHFSEWKQSMVLLFDEKVGRQPLIFFKRKSDILEIAYKQGISDAMESLARRFAEYRDNLLVPPMSFPVMAMEPTDDDGAAVSDRLNIMPIFNYDDSLDDVRLLEVASINPGIFAGETAIVLPSGESTDADDAAGAVVIDEADAAGGSGKLAVCFIVDVSESMTPYALETLNVIQNYYDSLSASGNAENSYLAFVAFRSPPPAAPHEEYGARLVSGFKNAVERVAIEEAIGQVIGAGQAPRVFNRDSIAAVNEALTLDWESFGGGLAILVTDAGPFPSDDPGRATRDDPAALKTKAEARGVRLATLHLRTAEGADNHSYAREAYEAMSSDLAGVKAYIPIEIQSPEAGLHAFSRMLSIVLASLDTANRSMIPVTPMFGAKPLERDLMSEERVRIAESLLGYSVRLDYPVSGKNASAPSVVRAWIPDRDLGFLDSDYPRDVRTVKLAVLLTKSQMDSLSLAVRAITEGAEDILSGNSRNFFDAILSAALKAGMDPDELNANAAQLSGTGLLGEYLDGLPYRSRVMTLNQDIWDSWSPNMQRGFLLELLSKLSLYEFIDSDVDNWLKTGADSDADWLYRVPLSALP